MQLQNTLPESKFPDEYSAVIFIQIDQNLKKLLQKYKGVPILWITVYMSIDKTATANLQQINIRKKRLLVRKDQK